MKRLVDLKELDRLNTLIRHKATGDSEELARRMNMSRSNLFKLIKFLKEEMKAPIIYDNSIQSYVYSYIPKFNLSFEPDTEQNDDGYTNAIRNKNDVDNYDANLDDNIDFNDLYL